MINVIHDIFAGIGFLTVVWLAASCIGSYMDKLPPSSHDIRRRPWTEDERDQRRKWDRIQGRRP